MKLVEHVASFVKYVVVRDAERAFWKVVMGVITAAILAALAVI